MVESEFSKGNLTMQKYLCTTMLTLFLLLFNLFGADTDIHLNSLGFLPGFTKKATITSECSRFKIVNIQNGKAIFSAEVTGPFFQADVNQNVWIADFSQFKKKDKFYLEVPEVGRSIDFEIGENVYNTALYTSMRAFYLWRCGTAVEGTHQGQRFAHTECHLQDGFLDFLGKKDVIRNGTGGWHDAGDHGKYVVNAGITVGMLFYAWDHFHDKLKRRSFDLPETAPGYPDLLKELKWEIDWLLKMQVPDSAGQVSHKLTRLNFSGFIMPEDDTEKRYFTDWSSAATADFVAMLAMAARYFKPFDKTFSDTCLKAAERSYHFLKNHPENKMPNIRAFRTGGYFSRDNDDRLWAAAEMWETSGEVQYLADFEQRAGLFENKIDRNWDWGNVKNMGMFTYLLSKRKGKNSALLADIRKALIAVADSIVESANTDVYGRTLGGKYYWGCNGTVARQVLNLQVANMIAPNKKYVNAALDAIAHLFGRNYYGRSFVTGLGHNPPMNPHDRRSGADNIEAPWPGYIVGGGHSAVDWVDEQRSFQTNEVAINWQAALVYALAGFVNGSAE